MTRIAMFGMFILAAAWLPPGQARAATASALLGDPVKNRQGERVGAVSDLIVDVRAGRVLYLVVEGAERFHTLPMRALEQGGSVDMRLANAVARDHSPEDPKFRRAARLIGQPITNPGNGRIGAIADIEFDPQSGKVQQVLVRTDDGLRNMPPAVLAAGRFPPLTQWQVQHPPADVAERQGLVRREASDDRKRLHEHQW